MPDVETVAAQCGGEAKECSCGCKNNPSPKNPSIAEPSYVYALGRIEPRFPSIGIEREYRDAARRVETKDLTDRQVFAAVLSKRENKYLIRQMCWVFLVESVETYVIYPRDPSESSDLVEALQGNPIGEDIDLLIGFRNGFSSPALCGGLTVPVVHFEQLYTFTRPDLTHEMLGKDSALSSEQQAAILIEVLQRVLQLADNAGNSDSHRALNFMAARYQPLYKKVAEMYGRNFSFDSIEVRESRLSGSRKVVEVVILFRNRNSDVPEKFLVRVDVTELFPFTTTPLSPFVDY
jgi:hypothetical protein